LIPNKNETSDLKFRLSFFVLHNFTMLEWWCEEKQSNWNETNC